MKRRGGLPRWVFLVCLLAPACHGRGAEGEAWLEAAPAPSIAGTSVRTSGAASLERLRGRVVMLSFGYTHCADICPVTMRTMQGVLRELGPEAREVAPVYVSIDPARDSSDRVREFVKPFDDRIDAWLVPDAALQAALRGYGESAARQAVNLRRYVGHDIDPNDYSLSHTGGVWVIDRRGRLRARYAHGASEDVITAGVRRLLDEAPRTAGA